MTDHAHHDVPTVLDVADLPSLAPCHLGFSGWRTVDQVLVDGFANLTDDRQRIHIDPGFASTTIFGTTVAHGFLVVSLIPSLFREILTVRGAATAVNYGAERLRFPGPVPVGSRIRAGAEFRSADLRGSGCLARVRITIQVEDAVRPACLLDALWLYVSD